MVPGSVFERVYAALKKQLREGHFAPGERLEPSSLAADLVSSVTPVRDALHRLAGERLVQAARQNGFRVPLLTERDLRQLYNWHGDLADLIAARPGKAAALISPLYGGPALRADAECFFLELAAASDNPEHLQAPQAASDRLMPFRRREPMLFQDWEDEARELTRLAVAGERAALKRAVRAYHRRRIRCVSDLLALAGSDQRRQ